MSRLIEAVLGGILSMSLIYLLQPILLPLVRDYHYHFTSVVGKLVPNSNTEIVFVVTNAVFGFLSLLGVYAGIFAQVAQGYQLIKSVLKSLTTISIPIISFYIFL